MPYRVTACTPAVESPVRCPFPRVAVPWFILMGVAACSPSDSDTAAVTGTDTATVTTTGTGTATGSAVSDCDRNHPNRPVGLLYCDPRASEGYTLFAPNRSETTYLIDLEGNLVHSWTSNYEPGESVYLLDNGNLLRTAKDTGGTPFFAGGAGGRIEEIDWDGNVVWSFSYKSSTHLQHHDIEQLPNGNILMIAWELKTEAEAIAAGRDPGRVNGSLWVNHLVEVDPATDAIVWEWHLWDHLVQDFDASKDNFGVIADNPGKVDLNATSPGPPGEPDWNHVNGLDYNADLDQIVLSAHHPADVVYHSHMNLEQAASEWLTHQHAEVRRDGERRLADRLQLLRGALRRRRDDRGVVAAAP